MNALKRAIFPSLRLANNLICIRQYSGSIFEPDYLEQMKSSVPLYDTLNIQLRGYDYPVLENYQRFLHHLIKQIDINVEDSWGVPAQVMQIKTYKPQSEVVSAQYTLNLYERTVQITDVSSLQLPVVLRAIEASTPAGVTVHVVPHEDYHEEIRYCPDTALEALKQELDELGGFSKKK